MVMDSEYKMQSSFFKVGTSSCDIDQRSPSSSFTRTFVSSYQRHKKEMSIRENILLLESTEY